MHSNRYASFLRWSLVLTALAFAGACAVSRKATDLPKAISFYKVGHRGTRGLMPENTIPAFEKGIAVGANTIEFDIHVTRDSQVVIYHDESFTPAYTTMPDGSDIPPSERKKYTFYQMNYADIRAFVIGKKFYPAFPHQHLEATYAPLLTEMIDSVEAFTRRRHDPAVVYLLEVKSSPSTDGFAQPAPEPYMRILMATLKPYLKALDHRLIIHSFDMRPLQILHRDYPRIPLGYLTDDKKTSFTDNLRALGFTPAFYNPQFSLVNPTLLKECHEKGIKVLPWTVENLSDMQRLKDMGADGIITDYPDRIAQLK